MSSYTNMRWETAPEGYELWGLVEGEHLSPFEDRIELLAWVYRAHHRKKWVANVYAASTPDMVRDFDLLEEAQAWCWACVRTS